MFEIKVDDKDNRLFPHPKVLEAYVDEKRGNGFQRQRRPEDDTYENFYNACRKNPFNCQAKTIVRTRTIKNGKLQEIVYYFAHVKGTNSAGQELEYPMWFGVYDEPIFNKKLDKETDNFVVENVRDHVRKYEYEFDSSMINEIFKYADDATVLMVKESPEITQGYPITDAEGFKSANFLQLLEMGKSKRSLKEIIELSKNTLAISDKKQKTEVNVAENLDIDDNLDDSATVRVTRKKNK